MLRLGDRHLQVGGLEVVLVPRDERVGDPVGLVEAAQVPQAAAFEVEGEAVVGVGLEHRVGFGEGLVEPLRLREHLAEGEADAHVARLDLEGLPVVKDRLIGLLRAGVDVAEDLVGPCGVRLQLERGLERGGRLLGLAREEEVRAALHVGLEVPGVELEVQLPGAGRARVGAGLRLGRVVVVGELAVDAGEVQEGLPVGRSDPHDLLVLRGRGPQGGRPVFPRRLDLEELGQDEMSVGVLLVETHRRPRLGGRVVEAGHLPQEARRLDADRRRAGIQLLRAAVLRESLLAVARQARLQSEAEVVVRLGRVGLGGRGRLRRGGGRGRLRGGGGLRRLHRGERGQDEHDHRHHGAGASC